LTAPPEHVNEHIMDNGLAYRRDRLRDEILNVRTMVAEHRESRRALRRRGLVKSRRTGQWYALNMPPTSPADTDIDPFPPGF
jgi:hypothetical protein